MSETINLPGTGTPEDVVDIYRKAWQLQAKDVTVYRYGSTSEQLMNLATRDSETKHPAESAAGSCPRCMQ